MQENPKGKKRRKSRNDESVFKKPRKSCDESPTSVPIQPSVPLRESQNNSNTESNLLKKVSGGYF